MREFLNRPPGFQRTARGDDFTQAFIRAIPPLSDTEARQTFLRKLTEAPAPDVQAQLYALVIAMIRAWAGRQSDLCHEDGAVIEDCRKICDVMGWQPGE